MGDDGLRVSSGITELNSEVKPKIAKNFDINPPNRVSCKAI